MGTCLLIHVYVCSLCDTYTHTRYRALLEAFRQIDTLCDRMSLNRAISTEAQQFYKTLDDERGKVFCLCVCVCVCVCVSVSVSVSVSVQNMIVCECYSSCFVRPWMTNVGRHVYVFMHARMYVQCMLYMYIYIYMVFFTRVFIQMYLFTYIRRYILSITSYIHVYVYTHIPTVSTRVFICMYVYAHIYIYINRKTTWY